MNDLQEFIARKLMDFSKKSSEGMVHVFPELLLDAINYGVAEKHTLNCKRVDGTYLHQINFMGFKFIAVSGQQVYNSDEFFKERPAR